MIFSYNFRINVTEVPVTVYECTLASLCRYAPVKPNQSTEAILQPEKSYSVNKKNLTGRIDRDCYPCTCL